MADTSDEKYSVRCSRVYTFEMFNVYVFTQALRYFGAVLQESNSEKSVDKNKLTLLTHILKLVWCLVMPL